MALTSANALKALIESLELGIEAYRDDAPQGVARPYVTITEQIALVPEPMEDGGLGPVAEMCAVDLWQDWRDLATDTVVENYTLAPALVRGMHGQRLNTIGTKTPYVVLVVGPSPRLLERDENIVHHALTVEIYREL